MYYTTRSYTWGFWLELLIYHFLIVAIFFKSITDCMLLLNRFFKTSRPVFLDSYEGDSTFTILTNNLSCLFEDSPRAATLRELIIDKKVNVPTSINFCLITRLSP